MTGSPRPGPLGYEAIRDLKWSAAEKGVARKAFDSALQREFEQLSLKPRKGRRKSNNRPASGIWNAT